MGSPEIYKKKLKITHYRKGHFGVPATTFRVGKLVEVSSANDLPQTDLGWMSRAILIRSWAERFCYTVSGKCCFVGVTVHRPDIQ